MRIEKLKTKLNPAELFRAIKDLPYSMMLESQKFSRTSGQFSFLFADPETIFKSSSNNITIIRNSRAHKVIMPPFLALKELLREFKPKRQNIRLPFSGMAVGYFSYEMRHFIEKLPCKQKDAFAVPDCVLGFYRQAIIYDHFKKEVYFANSGQSKGENLKDILLENSAKEKNCFKDNKTYRPVQLRSNFSRNKYVGAVNRVKEYIRNGDIYQANLSQRFITKTELAPYAIFEKLRRINPVDFAAYLNLGDFIIISASPERFLRLKNGLVETKPMKGTRPRGSNKQKDMRLKNELLKSKKDRAELVMIVDLERNDLGRVCEYGSVHVKKLRDLEKYETVFQTTATVFGRLKKDKDAIDLLEACFPGGSITGAPKIRAMEIINEIEPTMRTIYTGAIGYIDFSGGMDLSVAIRTMLIKNNNLCFHVGGGIVADSRGDREYQETLDKARAIFKAIAVN